jgi:hypothetical protein
MQTVQLARDSGRMYARPGMDMTLQGNQTVLATVGTDLGLKTDGTGKAVLILTTLKYIDKGTCPQHDAGGNPINCPNYKSWVFVQRITIGNSSIRASNLGSPTSVTVDPTTHLISTNDQITNTGDQANFASGNPFVSTPGTLDTLPSGQVLYVAEAAAQGFTMLPFATGGMMYAFNVF